MMISGNREAYTGTDLIGLMEDRIKKLRDALMEAKQNHSLLRHREEYTRIVNRLGGSSKTRS